jgi:hypothetical protein
MQKVRLLRARDLIQSAISDFFTDPDDVIALGSWLDDDEPFPAARRCSRSNSPVSRE